MWAGQPPACKENIYCLQPPTIEHARHSALPEQATFDLDATVQYNCHTGYVTNGFPRAKCLAIDGQASWYGPDITCEPRSCGEPGDVPHGWVTADCHTFGCRAVVQCGQGFELVGKAERYCQSDGAWAPKELPTCVLVTQVQCPPPEAPRHGKAVYTSCAYNSVVSYECKYGYRLVGDATRRCGADKKWSGTQPICKEINCGHPGQLWNGWLENISSGTGLGASIIFRCQDGMRMEGNGSAICQSDGTWSHPLPMCLAPCVVPHVSQGRVVLMENKTQDNETQEHTQIVGSSTMVQHGEIIVVECEKDYEFPSTSAAITCNNGTWTQIPRCQPARCKKMPKYPRNGMVIAPKTEHGMKARFRCKDGYELKGNPIVVCSFGTWSGETPKCEELFCPFPGYIENGKVLLVGNMGLYDYRPYVKKVVNNKQIICTLYKHPRIRWSRRRRSIPDAEVRHRRSAYLRQYYNSLRRQVVDSTKDNVDQLYDKYNHNTEKPTLRHANFKMMKKFDIDFDGDTFEPETPDEGNIPTAVYTIFNIHGEPVAHKFYSYQPVYEPEEGELIHHDDEEYDSEEGEDDSQMTILKGGTFSELDPDHGNSDNINKLKHQYFERYVDKRWKRFSGVKLEEIQNNTRSIEATQVTATEPDFKSRKKRNINYEEYDRDVSIAKPTQFSELLTINEDHLKVIPLQPKLNLLKYEENESVLIPVKYNGTNSTEFPTSGRESKSGKNRQAQTDKQTAEESDISVDVKDISEFDNKTLTEKGKKGRPKSPCEPIESEPYVNIEVVKFGRDPNNTFSSGTIVRVACGKGYGLNLEINATAKCVRGRWKPEKPKCEVQSCHVPVIEYGIYTMSPNGNLGSLISGPSRDEEQELNETIPVPNGQIVHFSSPCELPQLTGATYEAGYRSGLTVAHASSVNVACDLDRSPPATLNCHLGRLQPTVQDFCKPLVRKNVFAKSAFLICWLERLKGTEAFRDAKPWMLGTLIYREGAEVNETYDISDTFPHGVKITFSCIASVMGEKTTWKIICENGNWVGKSFNCEELDAQSEELRNNNTCTFRNEEPNVVSFYNDLEITETVEFSPGAVIVSRCSDVGKYAMTGSQTRRCIGGIWDGVKPTCFGLNQENDYAMEKPPTILFRHSQGPIAQTNDGKLLVYPGTVLHMECLWMRRFGNPKWNVTHTYPESERTYAEGWTTDPGRDSQLEYRLSIMDAVREDSGVYRCETPARQSHQVEIIVEDVHCPPLPIRRGLVPSSLETRLGSEITFSCANEVSCPALPPPASGYVLGRAPYRAGDVLQFHCNPEHTLHGRPILVCQDSGRWSDKPPTCAQACTYPGTTISGRMSSVKFYYKIGESVSFTCEPGYKIKGAPMLRCLKNRKWSNAIPLCTPISNYTSADSIAMLNGDIDAMLSDGAILPTELSKLETPAILTPESYNAAMTRVAATRLLRRGSIESYKNRIYRVNRILRRDTGR
ncbi:unnamed protein product [Leptidea sinapis]|uniref:Sushi domain-containing protein n=1 Tax=Leptidea sinapis TaxID=189913 RepID=A0A5E4Q5C8_9NEOP|nr:unnamed protein product [Leptidea sinapis]